MFKHMRFILCDSIDRNFMTKDFDAFKKNRKSICFFLLKTIARFNTKKKKKNGGHKRQALVENFSTESIHIFRNTHLLFNTNTTHSFSVVFFFFPLFLCA